MRQASLPEARGKAQPGTDTVCSGGQANKNAAWYNLRPSQLARKIKTT